MVEYKRMLFEKIFSGNQSSKEMHSNQYAAGSVSQRTFSQRKAVEQGRSRIASYRQSKLGWSVAPRTAIKSNKHESPVANNPRNTGGSDMPAIDRPQREFQEPTQRKYNPYN